MTAQGGAVSESAASEETRDATLRSSQRSQLERIIKQELPQELFFALGVRPTVDRPTCILRSGGQFGCLVRFSWWETGVGQQWEKISIEGVCDDRNCRWEVG
jgi:hypothetical protein